VHVRRVTAAVLAALAIAACGGSPGGDETDVVRFAIWGDTPYSGPEAAAVPQMVDQINEADVSLTIMVGDLFAERCENRLYTAALDTFRSFEAPLVYVPGDNEWTDCHMGAMDPLERLAHIRRTMFARPESFGTETLQLVQQRPEYPENSRWKVGSVLFASLNVAGSNNGHIADPDAEEQNTPRTAADRRAAEAEYLRRDGANREWLRQAFELARRERAPAVVVAIHADPGFAVPAADRRARRVDGFDPFLRALTDEARAFAKPVVLVHGDSHRHVVDRPLIDAPNLLRVETFGSPDVGWVEIALDPRRPQEPKVQPHLVRSGR
jgi:hypothetical protein